MDKLVVSRESKQTQGNCLCKVPYSKGTSGRYLQDFLGATLSKCTVTNLASSKVSFDTHDGKLNLQYRVKMSGSEYMSGKEFIKMRGNILTKTRAGEENLFNLRKLPFFVLSTVWIGARRRVKNKVQHH